MPRVLKNVTQGRKIILALCAVYAVIDCNEADAVLWENHFIDMDKTTKNLYGVADNPGTYDGAGIFLFKLAYNFTL